MVTCDAAMRRMCVEDDMICGVWCYRRRMRRDGPIEFGVRTAGISFMRRSRMVSVAIRRFSSGLSAGMCRCVSVVLGSAWRSVGVEGVGTESVSHKNLSCRLGVIA